MAINTTQSLHKEMKAALRPRDKVVHRVRQNDLATIEPFKNAEVDCHAAYDRCVDALVIKNGVVDE